MHVHQNRSYVASGFVFLLNLHDDYAQKVQARFDMYYLW